LLIDLHRQGLGLLLVEHNLGEVLRVAQRLVVIDSGAVLADGAPQAVMAQPEVRRAYLGEAHA
jgi:branched-chain amino acid transport system ATP-binding protein